MRRYDGHTEPEDGYIVKCRRSTRMGDVFVTVSTIESRCLFGGDWK